MQLTIKEINNYQEKFRKANLQLDDLIRTLKESGASITDSIKIVRNVSECSLKDAKTIVSSHAVWKHAVNVSDRFHRELEKALLDDVK